MKVVINRDACIGCGACESINPDVFKLDDEGVSTVICNDFNNIDKDMLMDAVESCPTGAIENKEE